MRERETRFVSALTAKVPTRAAVHGAIRAPRLVVSPLESARFGWQYRLAVLGKFS